jgi:hypothetical protein
MYQTQRPAGPPPTGQGITDRLDVDKSGGLSASEIEDTRLGKMIGDRFGEVDTDSDGALSVSELDTELKANGPPEGGRPPPPPPGEGGGAPGIAGGSQGVDMESLFETLFAALETDDDSESSQLTTVAQTLYTQMQTLMSDSAAI